MKNHTPFSRKRRQFNFLLKQLKQDLQNGKWPDCSTEGRKKIFYRFRRLLDQLQSIISPLKRAGLIAGVASLVSVSTSEAQTYTFVQSDPFGIAPVVPYRYHTSFSFVDIDDDSDLDLFEHSHHNFFFYENIGTATTPVFDTVQTNPMGLAYTNFAGNSMDFADFDNDGDMDIMELDYIGNINYYQNVGTATAATFATPAINPFGANIPSASYFGEISIEIVDLDGDSDFDLMVSGYLNFGYNVGFIENIGSPAFPTFDSLLTGAYGTPTDGYPATTFADVDCDGDLDMLQSIGHTSNLNFFENTSGGLPPAFAAPVPLMFGFVCPATYVSQVFNPEYADIDNDGDLELFVGTEYNHVLYYELTCSTALDANWSHFTAESNQDGGVDLEWGIASGANLDYFNVYRSDDLANWEQISTVSGANGPTEHSLYEYHDGAPLAGVSFYLITEVNNDGTSHSSESRRVYTDVLHLENLIVYPNPTSGLLHIEGPIEDFQPLQVLNSLGEQIAVKTIDHKAGELTLDLSKVATGIYFLKGRGSPVKIIKNSEGSD